VVDAGGGFTPTPVISHAILTHNRGGGRGTADGIVVTPSHNPPRRDRARGSGDRRSIARTVTRC